MGVVSCTLWPLYHQGEALLTHIVGVRKQTPLFKSVPSHFTDNLTLHIALMMEAASTSEASALIYQTTRRNNPEDSHLQLRVCTNLKALNLK
jgi:hypothetical protein